MENKEFKNILKNLNSKKNTDISYRPGVCGTSFVLALCKANFKVYGIDNSDERVDLLRSGKLYFFNQQFENKKL